MVMEQSQRVEYRIRGVIMKVIKKNLTFYCSEKMNEIPGLVHGFSSRMGGVSEGAFASLNFGLQDDPCTVAENYRLAMDALGISHLVMGHQQHTDRVRAVTLADAGRGLTPQTRFPDGVDGLTTNENGLALGVLGADCPGILFCDPVSKSIGAAHSGWRGTVMKIGAKTVLQMKELYGADPKNILAVIGPSIRQCCFETGLEVAEEFQKAYGGVYPEIGKQIGDKAYLNLPAAICYDLEQVGVLKENISVLPHCTVCENDTFFSHRKGDRGRICGFIVLN